MGSWFDYRCLLSSAYTTIAETLSRWPNLDWRAGSMQRREIGVSVCFLDLTGATRSSKEGRLSNQKDSEAFLFHHLGLC